MAKVCIGIDLGGTYVKTALLAADSSILRQCQSPTPGDGPDQVVTVMARDASALVAAAGLTMHDVLGVGIGSPGPLDLQKGLVIAMPNIPGFSNYPLRDRLAARLGRPAVLENDANAAGLGEFLAGSGQGLSDMVLLTLGTGVGGGIIVNKHLVHGAHSIGAELGHLIVYPGGEMCGCGQQGCLERYASATFLAQYAQREVEKGRPSALAGRLRQKGTLDSADVNELAKAGDELAGEAWGRAIYYLAIGCVSICRILDPDAIVFGGGMAAAGDDLLTPLKQRFEELHWKLLAPQTRLALASLGNQAGVIGAAGVAWDRFGKA
jgi:glucokinase